MKNRIIKIKVYDYERKQIIPICEIGSSHNTDFLTLVCQIPERFQVIEFAGFYAKDERPCYEGDIINFGGYNLAIVFQKGEFVGKFKEEIEDENIPGFIIRHEAHNFEVVGNVFENLDLVSSTSILPKKT